MAGIYNTEDKTLPFALPYGEHNIHSGNGKLIRHQYEAVGSELQVTAQLAMAMGVLNSVVKATYDGAEIPAENYIFHKGTPNETAADAYFPDDVNHWTDADQPGASWINFRLPPGMATDNKPDKAVFRVKCRETADYNSTGTQTGFDYSANPARAAVDAIKIITGNTDLVEWSAFDEYKAWCDEEITITKDDVEIQVPRFRLDAFFMPPFTLKELLDRICQLTCSDWQERKGKIRFMPAITRTSVFNFDLTKVSRDFKFQTTDRKSRYNGVRGRWRNLDDELLREGKPIIVDRRASSSEVENFYELNLGVCYQDQGERTVNYWAKVYCDLLDFALITGSFKSYITLPGDLVTLTHPTPAWNNKTLKIIKKTENEDTGIGYKHYLRVEPANPYSDTDFTPIVTRDTSAGLSPYAAPPVPVFTLEQESVNVYDGSILNKVVGSVTFGAFGYGQRAKVYIKTPGASDYKHLTDITPDIDNTATFSAANLSIGQHYFKVVAFSDNNVPQAGSNAQSVTIEAGIFRIDNVPISPGAARAIQAIRPDYRLVGRDTKLVPTAAIQATIDTAEIIGENAMCVIAVSITDLPGGEHNQADSASVCQVDVFNQFGPESSNLPLKSFAPAAVTLKAATATSSFPRKYADPREGQSYFRIKIYNAFGWSNVVYLQGTTLTTTPPTPKVRANCPLELGASPVSANAIQITFQFGSSCNLYRRLVGETAWVQHVTGISASPFNATDFSESTDYELQLRSAANEANRSNIRRVKTKQQPPLPPTRTAPTALDGSPNSAAPTTQIDVSWSRNATDNTNVEIYLNNSLHDTVDDDQTWYNFTSLSAGTAYTIKVRNKWGTGDYSAFSNEKTITTDPTPPPPEEDPRPEITSGYYSVEDQAMYVYFDKHANTGNFTVDYNLGSGWTRLYTGTVSNSAISFTHSIPQIAGTTQYITYRVARYGTGSFWEFGNEMPFEIPPGDNYYPGGGGFPELP